VDWARHPRKVTTSYTSQRATHAIAIQRITIWVLYRWLIGQCLNPEDSPQLGRPNGGIVRRNAERIGTNPNHTIPLATNDADLRMGNAVNCLTT
jgi:hypothetical protein